MSRVSMDSTVTEIDYEIFCPVCNQILNETVEIKSGSIEYNEICITCGSIMDLVEEKDNEGVYVVFYAA